MPEERHGRRPEAYPPAHASVVRLRLRCVPLAPNQAANVASLGRYRRRFELYHMSCSAAAVLRNALRLKRDRIEKMQSRESELPLLKYVHHTHI